MGAKIENGCLVVTTKSACPAAELDARIHAMIKIAAHCSATNFKGDALFYLMSMLGDMLPDEKQISKYLLQES